MTVAVLGGSGFIGSSLIPFLKTTGFVVRKLEHGKDYNIEKKELSKDLFNDVSVVINLSGESIASRWSEQKKREIFDSRVKTTAFVCEMIENMHTPPQLLLNASAIGYYGNRGSETLTESSHKGTGFLSDLVQSWEDATKPAQAKGVRVVNLRFGVILSSKGGALKSLLLPFKFGLGGNVGSGKQFMSWVALDDLLGVVLHTINHSQLNGPINVVSSQPIRNEEFTAALGEVLHRPTLLPLPEFMIKTVFGQMGEEVLLSSTKAEPKKLLESGYPFLYPNIKNALNHLLRVNNGIS